MQMPFFNTLILVVLSFGAAAQCPVHQIVCQTTPENPFEKVARRFSCDGAVQANKEMWAHNWKSIDEFGRCQHKGAFLDDYLLSTTSTTSATTTTTTKPKPKTKATAKSTVTPTTSTSTPMRTTMPPSGPKNSTHWHLYKDNNKFYKLFTAGDSCCDFEQARVLCEAAGKNSHLAAIQSQQEHWFIYTDVLLPALEMFSDAPRQIFWTALRVDWSKAEWWNPRHEYMSFVDGSELTTYPQKTNDDWPWPQGELTFREEVRRFTQCVGMLGWRLSAKAWIGLWVLELCESKTYTGTAEPNHGIGFVCKADYPHLVPTQLALNRFNRSKVISLFSVQAGKYVRAVWRMAGFSKAHLRADAKEANKWEKFTVERIGAEAIGLKAHMNDKYVGVDRKDQVVIDSAIERSVIFLAFDLDGYIVLKSYFNNRFLKVNE